QRTKLSIHVHLQAFALDDLGEFRRLRLHEVGILLRRAPVGRRAHVTDGLLDIIALKHRLDLLVERLDGGSGRGLRQEDAEPGGDVEVRKFGYALAYAWDVRRRRAALGRGHAERGELAILGLRQRRVEVVEQDLDVAGQCRLQRRTCAAEWHMDHLQAGELQEPGAGEV